MGNETSGWGRTVKFYLLRLFPEAYYPDEVCREFHAIDVIPGI